MPRFEIGTKLKQNWNVSKCACTNVHKSLIFIVLIVILQVFASDTRVLIMSSKKKTSHKAKTSSDWTRRLRLFAAGQKFGRGERPAKDSQWHKVVGRIESCPAHGGTAGVACVCQYHQPVSCAT